MEYKEFLDGLYKVAQKNRIPVVGTFELTSRCNLSCKMCYINHPAYDPESISKELSAKVWINLAREARDEGMLFLLLTGGEVFIRPDFQEIYEEVSDMGFIIDILTNATLLTSKIIKWLGKIPPSKVGVTLYGASRKTYENVCGNGNGFDLAVRGIDLLLQEGITVELRTTIIKRNVQDFDKMIQFADKRNIPILYGDYIFSRKDGTNITLTEEERLTPEELDRFRSYTRLLISNDPTKLVGINLNKFSESEINSFGPYCCKAGNYSFWMTWDGRMSPCGQNDTPYTLPQKIGIKQAWQDLYRISHEIPVCKECNQCSLRGYCITCPAALKSETGFFDKPAHYLCEFAKLVKARIDREK